MFKDPKRKVNLSSKQTLTKQQLLEKNQKEREERQLNMLKETSALKIQNTFKVHQSRLEALKQLKSRPFHGKTPADRIARNLVLNVKVDPEIAFDWKAEDERLSFLFIRLLQKQFSLRMLSRICQIAFTDDIPSKRLIAFLKGDYITQKLVGCLGDSPVQLVVEVALRILQLRDGNISQLNFVKSFMTLPRFFDLLPVESQNFYLLQFPYQNLLHTLVRLDSSMLGKNERLLVFANFMYLSKSRLSYLNEDQIGLYISVINMLMEDLPVQRLSVQDEDSDDEMLIESSLLDRAEFQSIADLISPSHILQILKSGGMNISLICTYLVGIMSRFPASRLEIASIVLYQFDKSFLQKTLDYYLNSALCLALSNDPLLAFSNTLLIGDWYVLVILCEFYSRFLLTVSDEEFHSRELNLYQSFIPLTATLKQVAFHLFWSLPLNLSPPLLTVQYAQNLFSKFVSQIHDRDSRKHFCPTGHWLIANQELLATLSHIPKDYTTNDILSEKVRASISILKNIPFVVPFEERVKTFRSFLISPRDEWMPPKFHAQVKRGQVFEDGYAQLNALGPKLRERIAITFIDAHGMVEAGIDGGGVFKEFLTDCLKQAFEPNLGLFVSTSENLLYPSPLEYASQEEQLMLFEFLGRIIGKALYERVLIDVPFAPFFLSKWLGKKSYLDDLPLLDKELYQGLMFLKSYEGDMDDLSLSFSLDINDFGENKVVDLIKGGRSIPVTKENRMKYVYLVANYKLNLQISRPCRYFFRGLSDLINPEWLLMFSENELQVLIGGEQSPIDVEQMAEYVKYDSVYDKDHPTIQFFWEAVREFSYEDRALLLKFITSTPRAPLLGFGELQPPICIRFSGQDQSRLPTASTCINLLKLPAYQTRKLLKE